MRQVKNGDYRQIVVQLPDGNTLQGKIGPDGRLYIETPPDQQQQQAQQAGNGVQAGGKLPPLQGKALDIPKDMSFKQRLASILKDNAYKRMTRHQTRGKLDMGRLYKARMAQETVFKRKSERRGKNYNVALVVDESGSMHGARINTAAQIAAFLADNFQQIQVDLAVVGYSSDVKVRKGFDEKMAPVALQEKILREFMGDGTNDFNALKETYKMLNQRDGESIVLVLTDGEGYPPQVMKPLIEANKMVARTFAIGIGCPTPGYPKGVIAKNLDELKPLVLNILQSQIVRA